MSDVPRADQDTRPESLLRPVTVSRASESIVTQLRKLIREGHYAAGAKLPPERELALHFQVSRVTVREALRVLETNGLVEIRVGAHGGSFVTAPTSAIVSEGIEDLLQMSSLSPRDVTEARILLDLAIVPLACERATPDDIEDLLAICDEADELLAKNAYTIGKSADFHVRLAASTHNQAVTMLMESFRGPLIMSLADAMKGTVDHSTGLTEHREIARAIEARDVELATAIMQRHLDRTLSRVSH